jgi:hypothetical protein
MLAGLMIRNPVAAISLLLGVFASGARAGTIYVNAALATGANNGTSWADAFQGTIGLQSALGVALAGDEIWVAQGTYKPTTGTTRSVYFQVGGNQIYGGFAGTESALDQRDWVANVTTLSGDLNGNDGSGVFTDNSYHVINGAAVTSAAILDGFTVRGGNANGGSTNQDRGGGILCLNGFNPTVRNCIFRENRCSFGGGAGYVNSASPTFLDCRFESNLGGSFGGAFDTATSANTIWRRCVFTGNSAARAGAVEIFGGSNPTLINCVFWNNTSTGSGGGGALYVSSSSPVIRQCIVAGNHSSISAAGGILASPAIALSNNIFYFNNGPGGATGLVNNVSGGTCTWSCVQGIVSGTGNIASDPLFASLATGDLHLSQLSPCADAGNNASLPAGTTTDLDGLPRLADDPAVTDSGAGTAPIVDIGAYEVQNTLYVAFCAGDGSLATACPCGNTGAAGRGCRNSDVFSPGALLAVTGTSNPDTVVLSASDMLAGASCIFIQGDQQAANGILFGDGLRCVSGSLKRLYVKTAAGGAASAPGPGDAALGARSAALGDPIAPGTQRYYQVYYRDPVGTFCATPVGNDWNVTSGAIVNW